MTLAFADTLVSSLPSKTDPGNAVEQYMSAEDRHGIKEWLRWLGS
jgi:hypothetical protein